MKLKLEMKSTLNKNESDSEKLKKTPRSREYAEKNVNLFNNNVIFKNFAFNNQ